jgi:hypothetical protein
LVWVRLRFVGIFVLIFLLVAKWDAISTHADRLVRWLQPTARRQQAVSSDTEYFCPMCPGVLSEWPAKCPVCNMPLVRRAKGEATLLPSGVLARMQLSPYRLQLAGVQTSEVGYRPLTYEVLAPGRRSTGGGVAGDEAAAAADRFEAPLGPRDQALVRPGAAVEVLFPEREPLPASVESVTADAAGLARMVVRGNRLGAAGEETATLRVRVPVAEIEPFRAQPRGVPPLAPGETRRAYYCPKHPDAPHAKAGVCPRDSLPLVPRELAPHERLRWACPEHAEFLADGPDKPCSACGAARLEPRVIAYAPPGEVLAIPHTALLDTGGQKIVYVETMPGMFDGVEVEVGRRAGDYYPVVRGLAAGQKVATSGAFLLDAETRLSPSLASAYFGAGSGAAPSGSPPPVSRAANPLDALDLSPADRKLAEAQRVCPVTKLPLGSMGPLVRLESGGQTVFLCCPACKERYAPPGEPRAQAPPKSEPGAGE